MADTNETIADIIAEMRGQAGDDGYPLDIKHYSDRIEAAHKREMSKNASKNGANFGQLGDAAKLREAMRLVSRVAEQTTRGTITGEAPTRKEVDDWAMRLCDIIGAALAAPPRNCDVCTVKELNVRYNKFCYAHRSPENGCGGCPLNGEPCCELAWAQMPYEEGGAE